MITNRMPGENGSDYARQPGFNTWKPMTAEEIAAARNQVANTPSSMVRPPHSSHSENRQPAVETARKAVKTAFGKVADSDSDLTDPFDLLSDQMLDLAESVRLAARNKTMIHTDSDLAHGDVRKGKDVVNFRSDITTGFNTFGSDSDPTVLSRGRNETAISISSYDDSGRIPERVQFQTKIEKRVPVKRTRTELRRKGLFGYEPIEVEYDDYENREVDPPEMINPETGNSEPSVIFRYSFNSQAAGYDRGTMPPYMTGSNRAGNVLEVKTLLPASIADRLRTAIENNPQVVRSVVADLVIEEGGVDLDDFYYGRENDPKMEPPYDDLPKDWTIAIFGNHPAQEAKDGTFQTVSFK